MSESSAGHPGPASRPRRASAASRERILRAAIRHFGELGREGASVPAIARAAGFSHGRVYQLFGSREELYRAACERDLSDLLAEAARGGAGGGLAERLLGRLLSVREALPRHPLAGRMLRGGGDGIGDPCHLPAARALRAELRGELRAAVRAGEVRGVVRGEAGCDALLALARGLLLLPRPESEAEPDPARAGAELVARLLRPPRGRTSRGG